MTFLRFNSEAIRKRQEQPHLWFAWYPCWIYESKGVDISWVWLEWIERRKVADGWLRTRPGVMA